MNAPEQLLNIGTNFTDNPMQYLNIIKGKPFSYAWQMKAAYPRDSCERYQGCSDHTDLHEFCFSNKVNLIAAQFNINFFQKTPDRHFIKAIKGGSLTTGANPSFPSNGLHLFYTLPFTWKLDNVGSDISFNFAPTTFNYTTPNRISGTYFNLQREFNYRH